MDEVRKDCRERVCDLGALARPVRHWHRRQLTAATRDEGDAGEQPMVQRGELHQATEQRIDGNSAEEWSQPLVQCTTDLFESGRGVVVIHRSRFVPQYAAGEVDEVPRRKLRHAVSEQSVDDSGTRAILRVRWRYWYVPHSAQEK